MSSHEKDTLPPTDIPRDVLSKKIHESFYRGLRDGAIALTGFTGASMLAHRYSSFYRGFTFPAKAFFVLSGFTAVTMISAEQRMLTQYYGHMNAMPQGRMVPATWKDWLIYHKFFVVAATFTSSVGLGTLKWINERHVDPSVRVMNIRLFSQGATLFTILVALGLTTMKPKMVSKFEGQSIIKTMHQ